MLRICPLHRLEFGRDAVLGGSMAPLRVQVSAASAPAFHHVPSFLDDASSEAVYSPLRVSMRASAAHRPSSTGGGGGFSAADGAPRSSEPAAPELTRFQQPDLARFERPDLAARPGLSRAGSMRHAADATDLTSPGRRANEVYNAAVYKTWPDAASEVGRLQSGSQPDEATCSINLQSHLGTMADDVHSALPQHGPAPTQLQQAPMLNGLPQKALEHGTQREAVIPQASRTGSGHGLAAPGLLAHGSVPVQVRQVNVETALLSLVGKSMQAMSSEQLATVHMGCAGNAASRWQGGAGVWGRTPSNNLPEWDAQGTAC